jgi:hypothetical protein
VRGRGEECGLSVGFGDWALAGALLRIRGFLGPYTLSNAYINGGEGLNLVDEVCHGAWLCLWC